MAAPAFTGQLIDMPWKSESFFDREYFSEIRYDFQCWNSSNTDKTQRTINKTYKSFEAADSMYLSDSMTTGEIVYSFSHEQLNSTQFALWHLFNSLFVETH